MSTKKSEAKSKKEDKVGQVVIIPRAAWGAQPAKSKVPMENPVKEIVYTETSTKSCSNKKECKDLVKNLQKYHMDMRDLYDIEHHFLVGGDGIVYEGRGWNIAGSSFDEGRPGAGDSTEKPEKNLEIAFIGTFKEGEIPQEMIQAAEGLISYGIENNLVIGNEDDDEIDKESDDDENKEAERKK